MSYSAVLPVQVKYTDGTPLFSIEVPVEDLADTLSYRLWPLWQDMVDVGVARVDNYMQQKILPRMTEESNRLAERAESLSLKTGLGAVALTASVLGALYWYAKRGK